MFSLVGFGSLFRQGAFEKSVIGIFVSIEPFEIVIN